MRRILTRDNLLSLVIPPLIWMLHFLTCYGLVSLVCILGWKSVVVDAGIGVATVLALLLLAFSALVNYRKWASLADAEPPDADIKAFFALNTMMLSALSGIALVWVAFPVTMLPTCAA